MELQLVLNTYALDIFRKQADQDYISARANYRMRLRQQCLWSAHQAIEKYLKAILLFNGKSARFFNKSESTQKQEFGHNLDALVTEVKKIELLKIEFEPEDEKLISYLSLLGGANRYLSKTSYNTSDFLHRLDKLIWHIRRYCQYIPDRGIGSKVVVMGLQEAIVNSINNPSNKKTPHQFKLDRGELESVISRNSKDPARKALVWANLWYGKKQRYKVLYDSFSSSEIPPNERDWKNVDWKQIEEYIKP